MNSYSFSVLFFAFCSLLVGILILLKRTDEVGKTFAIFNFLASGWGIANSWMFSDDPNNFIALQSTRFAHLCSLFIPPAWLHCVYAYSSSGATSEKKMRFVKFLYVWSFLIMPFTFSDWFIPSVKPVINFIHYPNGGPLYHFFTAEFFLAIGCAFFELFANLGKSSTNELRIQQRAFTIATFFAFLGGSLTFLPLYNIPFPQYGLYAMPLYPFIMAYSIIRHRLLDSEEVLAIHRDKLALVGLMSSSINHEIKNPLFILQELSRQLFNLDGVAKNAQAVNVLDKMSAQVERMNKLTTRLSEFSRPSSKDIEVVDLRRVVEDALFFASKELQYQKIEVKLNLPDNLPKVRGNKSQFEEIFLNLIINAFHAMPDGGVLKIEAKQTVKNKIEINIVDTGAGIPGGELKNIFKPFYTTKQKTGTGLGLHIVKTLVEQNNGTITLESELNKGTEFTLLLIEETDNGQNSFDR